MLLLSQAKTISFALSIRWQHFNKSQTNEIMNKLRSKQRRVKMLEDVLLPYHSIKIAPFQNRFFRIVRLVQPVRPVTNFPRTHARTPSLLLWKYA